jgi:hypothetical protein
VCDAYFSRNPFVEKVRQSGLHLITRLRDDAVMRYPYTGPQKEGRGRDKIFAGKVDVRQLDEQYFMPLAVNDESEKAFEAKVYINAWKCGKCRAKVVVVRHHDSAGKIKSIKVICIYFNSHIRRRFVVLLPSPLSVRIPLPGCQTTYRT